MLVVFGMIGIVSSLIFRTRNRETIAEVRAEEIEARNQAKQVKRA